MRTIVLTGGGTAGHVLPNIALLPYLKKKFTDINYIGDHNGTERDIVSPYKEIKYHGITTVKLRRALTLKNLAIPFKLLRGIGEAKKILKSIKPDVVFSKGGFVALPVVIAAHKLKIPIVAHESDITMGLANRLTAKKCSTICTTFPDTAKKFQNAVHTGAIIRDELFVASPQNSHIKPNLLIMGGSSGALAINRVIWSLATELTKHYNIVHVTGKGKSNHDIKLKDYEQIEYTNAPQKLFADADIVVSRAGSGALCELIALKKPTVFIPLPKTESRGDQILNANFAEPFGGCTVLPQESLNPETLLSAISKTKNKKWQNISWINGTKTVANIICGQ